MLRKVIGLIFFLILFGTVLAAASPPLSSSGLTLRLAFETESDILMDFLSSARMFREARPGTILADPLKTRQLEIAEGRFGKGLHIKNGWSVTKGTSNESGADLDLIVATIWGDWRNKPHYWGQGRISGDRGTVAFWVKAARLVDDPLYPIFLQTSIGWGRTERDLLRIDGDGDGRLSVSIRDAAYRYHRIRSEEPVWTNGVWQHIAVVYDQAYGIKLYHNGRLAASSWNEDAWWRSPLPGLFSPFLPESHFDEICLFDRPLEETEIAALYQANEVPAAGAEPGPLDDAARERLLAAFGDVHELQLPRLAVGREALTLRQTKVADCHDEKLPAWWVMDGRYELAWPHPYLSFTFILGDVDVHSEKFDIDLEPGERPNYLALEGVLDGVEVKRGRTEQHESDPLIALQGYKPFFYGAKLDLGSSSSLHFPMLKGTGTPPGLVDKGTLKFPLTGDIRIHEIHLWQTGMAPLVSAPPADILWRFPYREKPPSLDIRYLDALTKLASRGQRTLLTGSAVPNSSDRSEWTVGPLQIFHLMGPDLNPDLAVDRIRIRLTMVPRRREDVLWLTVRDPGNPSRVWAQSVIRLDFTDTASAQTLAIDMDPIDLMMASEDRLWLEMRFAYGGRILAGPETLPTVGIVKSPDRAKSLAEYARHELVPARMQYIKEYNYQPWHFTGEQRSNPEIAFVGGQIPSTYTYVSGQTQGLHYWSNFGGPYDMWYPPDAVLRHDPDHEIARTYKAITGERAQTYGGYNVREFTPIESVEFAGEVPSDAPAWAVWQREMYTKQLRTIRWIIGMQRRDGSFWGGTNDDTFIPLGYAGIPLMGEQAAARSFLKLHEGMDEMGIFKNGYCDIWPIDYLHITDFLTSRGLMLPFALGDPYVVEREMVAARAYRDIMAKNDADRAAKGSAPYVRSDDSFKGEAKLWGESLVRDYESTQVRWYWGKTPRPEVHRIADKDDLTRRMMTIATRYDRIEEYEWTRALRHTDRQGGAPGRNELITSALGGRLQGRIEPHPHSMVVSWDNPDPDIARWVSFGSQEEIRVNLYNFKDSAQRTNLRLWQIPKGLYVYRIGPDRDDDGFIDGPAASAAGEKLELRRFSTLPVEIPSQQNVAVQIRLLKLHKACPALPDLAIQPDRDIRQVDDELIVTVHNIGDGAARGFLVEVLDDRGAVITVRSVKGLAAPVDFVPKTIELKLPLGGRSWKTVVLDRIGAIEEIYEGNNEARRGN